MSFSALKFSVLNSGLRLALFVVLAALLMVTAGAPVAWAQDEGTAAFFRADRERMEQQRAAQQRVIQRPTHLIRRAAPVKGFTLDVPNAPSAPVGPDFIGPLLPSATPAVTPDTQEAQPAPPATDAPAAPKTTEAGFTIAVIGDSLGQMLGQGLTEAYADHPDISIQRRARENTGLVRDDYFDWVKAARDLAAGKDPLNAVVMMIGSNDRQQIRDGNTYTDVHSDRWRQIYAERVSAIAQAFHDRRIPFIWVGLPIMKSERFSADMLQLNELISERVARAGETYVDVWEAFQDDRGQYAAYGPDVNGQFQKLRAGDGVHFTKPGALKLAHFVEIEIKRLMDRARPEIDPTVAVVVTPPTPVPEPVPAAPVPAPPKPVAVVIDPLAALPAPAAPAAVVIPVKPAAGPVVPLTGPTVSPGGQLATPARPASTSVNEARVLLDRALVQGRPLEAKPGRADDFSWPPKP